MKRNVNKVWIVVTNYPGIHKESVVIRETLAPGVTTIRRDGCTFTIDSRREVTIASWGSYGKLLKKECKRLKADFGIWFSS